VLYNGAVTEKDAILAALRGALPDLRRRWPIRSLAVFGSVARDEHNVESDLDVLVEFERPIGLSAFLALEEALSGLAARRVDLVSAAALKPRIGQNIRGDAIVL